MTMTADTVVRTVVIAGALYVAALFLSDIVTDIRNGIRANRRNRSTKLS